MWIGYQHALLSSAQFVNVEKQSLWYLMGILDCGIIQLTNVMSIQWQEEQHIWICVRCSCSHAIVYFGKWQTHWQLPDWRRAGTPPPSACGGRGSCRCWSPIPSGSSVLAAVYWRKPHVAVTRCLYGWVGLGCQVEAGPGCQVGARPECQPETGQGMAGVWSGCQEGAWPDARIVMCTSACWPDTGGEGPFPLWAPPPDGCWTLLKCLRMTEEQETHFSQWTQISLHCRYRLVVHKMWLHESPGGYQIIGSSRESFFISNLKFYR